ncbi:aldehyde dehydrogenase [Limibacillus halophilus]|uniref:Aldehyde dehydrogenase (NAD+) n=1 Tax=Limibacillus halophilus TaxID=1579333 RepID=A0A839SQK3_9PROT|nr:aldehyde dehydrogenase [Limibacillus halophilus]MBB3064518.1 aldehyde dehydrogenase (NAD+) [Limibacillus halophilus]
MKLNLSQIENARLNLHIGGECRAPVSGRYFPSYDPATGAPWYDAAEAGVEDVNAAVSAARRALGNPAWRNITQTARGDLIFKLADLIGENAFELARIETRDNGKVIKETHAQISYLRDYYRYFAGMADKIQGDTIPVNKSQMLNYTTYEPIGVVGVIGPWNSPLNTMSVAVAPCLAVGNSMVVKPSEHTSATALAFAELIVEAGFPDGVFNVVTGPGATTGNALTTHPGIDKISFTGGTATGRKVATNAATHLAPCNLELGGKSPHVVFADADLERATNGLVAGVFAAGGQTCVAGARAFVQRPIYEEVVEQLSARAKSVRIGHPLEDDTELGPLALSQQLEKVLRYVSYGVEDGARLVAGGGRPNGSGWYFEPTVFADVTNDMRIARDEIFGPVVGVIPFDGEDDLYPLANDTVYGLAAGIWTTDIDRALRFAGGIDAGTIWINTYRTGAMMSPMGGFKDSGYGKHNGFAAIHDYARLKNIVVDYSGKTQDPFVIRVK